MESAARASGIAVRLPEGRPRAARARAGAARARDGSARTGSSRSCRPCWCARSRSSGPASCRPTGRRYMRSRTTTSILVGTSEVSLAALHADELLAEDELPLRYGGFSTCFRREAGAAGRDTRGIFRVHQFDKVEMFSFVRPEDSADEHERILSIEEGILQRPRDPLPGREHRRRRPRRLRREEVRLRGVAARAGPLPRADVVLEHDRLPGAPAALPLPAGRRRSPRPSTR